MTKKKKKPANLRKSGKIEDKVKDTGKGRMKIHGAGGEIKTNAAKVEIRSVLSSNVRKSFQDVIDSVHYTKKPVIITKYNKPWVIVKSVKEK